MHNATNASQLVKPKTPTAPGFFGIEKAKAAKSGGFDLLAGVLIVILAGIIATFAYLKYFKPELAKKLLGKLGSANPFANVFSQLSKFKPFANTKINKVDSTKPSNIFKG